MKEIRWIEKNLTYGPSVHLGYVGRILAFKIVKKLSGEGFYLKCFLPCIKDSIFFMSVNTAKIMAKEKLNTFIYRLELDQ